MAEYTEQVNKVSRPNSYGLIAQTSVAGDRWYYGVVRTAIGFVKVHSEPSFTVLSIMHDGFEVTRNYRRGFSRRTLVTMAARFAGEVRGIGATEGGAG